MLKVQDSTSSTVATAVLLFLQEAERTAVGRFRSARLSTWRVAPRLAPPFALMHTHDTQLGQLWEGPHSDFLSHFTVFPSKESCFSMFFGFPAFPGHIRMVL